MLFPLSVGALQEKPFNVFYFTRPVPIFAKEDRGKYTHWYFARTFRLLFKALNQHNKAGFYH
jgi:hypothetical protein